MDEILVRNRSGALVGKPDKPRQILSINSESYYYVDDNYVIKNNNNLDVQTVPPVCRGQVTGDLKLYYINGESNVIHVYDIKHQKELFTYEYETPIVSFSINDGYLWVQTTNKAYLYDVVYGGEIASTDFSPYIVRTLSSDIQQYADYDVQSGTLINVKDNQVINEYTNPVTYYYNTNNELVANYDPNILWEDKFLVAEKVTSQNHVSKQQC